MVTWMMLTLFSPTCSALPLRPPHKGGCRRPGLVSCCHDGFPGHLRECCATELALWGRGLALEVDMPGHSGEARGKDMVQDRESDTGVSTRG